MKILVAERMLDFPVVDFFPNEVREQILGGQAFRSLGKLRLRELLTGDEVKEMAISGVIVADWEELEARFIQLLAGRCRQSGQPSDR